MVFGLTEAAQDISFRRNGLETESSDRDREK